MAIRSCAAKLERHDVKKKIRYKYKSNFFFLRVWRGFEVLTRVNRFLPFLQLCATIIILSLSFWCE